MAKVCDSLVKNIYKNHNINNSINNSTNNSTNNTINNSINNSINNNSINNIPNKNYEIVNNDIFISDNKNKKNIFNNDIIEDNNSSNENEVNNSKDNNDLDYSIYNDDLYENIKNAKDLKKYFNFGRATGDGNCLFYTLSTATFGSDGYFGEIRNAICDYMENNYIEDLNDLNKEDYIKNMRKNGAFGGTTEVQVYSILSKLKIICFVRTFQEIKNYNADDSDSIYCFISGKEYNTEIFILLNVKERIKGKDDEEEKKKEKSNHYVPLKKRTINNVLSKEKRIEIKNNIGIINNRSKEKVKSILTGKVRGSRIGKVDWNPIFINNNNNQKGTDNRKYYTIEKIKTNKYLENNKVELNLNESIHLSEIIDEFKNVNNIGIDTFKQKYRNIIIDDIIINNTIHKVDSAFFKNELNLSEDTLDKFTNAICYDCSGYSKKDKPMFRIFRSLKYLKIHCRDNIDHRKDLNKCIFNYDLPENYVEIEVKIMLK